VVATSAKVLAGALQGGKQLTRNAIYQLLEQAGIATASSRGLHILLRLAHDQLICFGAREGKQPTFALLDEWAPAAKSLPQDEALATLALRYFTSHGPATIQDFMWWSGLTTKEAKAGLAATEGQLEHACIGEQEYYFARDLPHPPGKAREAYLLPPYDEFLVAYRDRSAALDPQYNTLIVPGGNGIFNPIVVIGGRVLGTWKRVFKGSSVALTFSPFETFSSADASAIRPVAERYSQFVGKRAVVEI
jgi:hypothetical protein